MKIEQWMSQPVITIGSFDNLEEAARRLWEHDHGALVVVDGAGKAVGMITDRDLCMAAYTQGRSLREIAVASAMSRDLVACRPDETDAIAGARLAAHQLHRLPVLDSDGRPVGMVSIGDLGRLAVTPRGNATGAGNRLAQTVAAIAQPRVAPDASAAPVATAVVAVAPPRALAATH